jgi:hypothetical protein
MVERFNSRMMNDEGPAVARSVEAYSILPLGHVSSKIPLIRPSVSPAQIRLSVQKNIA